jgi:hypothetical protein
MRRWSVVLPLALTLAGTFLVSVAGACPMCKDAYDDGTGASVASSFNPSILFMIGITFTVFFAVAFRIWWAYRHSRPRSSNP